MTSQAIAEEVNLSILLWWHSTSCLLTLLAYLKNANFKTS